MQEKHFLIEVPKNLSKKQLPLKLQKPKKQQKLQEIGNIQSLFNNRLVIIDEVHNIRVMQDNKEAKKTANLLMKVCKYADNMRLLLLSATPVFNDYREIIWLTNLLNAVDKRGLIEETDVFTSSGEFTESSTLPDGTLVESGEELLRRKLTGYISYVRGENPYTFPYRLYPMDFINMNASINAENQSIDPLEAAVKENYINIIENKPELQMNNTPLERGIQHMDLYTHSMEDYQTTGYNYVMEYMKHNMSDGEDYSKFENMNPLDTRSYKNH